MSSFDIVYMTAFWKVAIPVLSQISVFVKAANARCSRGTKSNRVLQPPQQTAGQHLAPSLSLWNFIFLAWVPSSFSDAAGNIHKKGFLESHWILSLKDAWHQCRSSLKYVLCLKKLLFISFHRGNATVSDLLDFIFCLYWRKQYSQT